MMKHHRTIVRLMATKVDLWVTILAAIITALGTIMAAYVMSDRRKQDEFSGMQAVQMQSPSLAEFPATDEYPRNSYNFEWKVFNDSKFLGESLIWYETVERTDITNDKFLRLHIATGSRSELPYCGVYTDFSYPPYKCLDVSQYRGIEFEARWLPESEPIAPALLFQVAILGIPCYKYHEAGFTVPAGDKRFTLVRIAFADLKTPSHAEAKYDFDPTRAFRIAFTLKGKNMKGSLDIDSIRLFR